MVAITEQGRREFGMSKRIKKNKSLHPLHPDFCCIIESVTGDQWVGVGRNILIFSTLELADEFLIKTRFKNFIVTLYEWSEFIEKIGSHTSRFAILDYSMERNINSYRLIPLKKD